MAKFEGVAQRLMEATTRALRVTVLMGEAEAAEAALVELLGLVAAERPALVLR